MTTGDPAALLPGLTAVRPRHRARARCADPDCGLLVYVDQLVFGYGRCCAEKRGLIIRRHRFAAAAQTGETLLDHLPEEHHRMEPYPQPRIDVTGLDPADAHRKIVDHARFMIGDPSGEIAAAYPNSITAAADDAFRGLIGILERHAPSGLNSTGSTACGPCDESAGRPSGWPCDDYYNAARGLATGLPEARA